MGSAPDPGRADDGGVRLDPGAGSDIDPLADDGALMDLAAVELVPGPVEEFLEITGDSGQGIPDRLVRSKQRGVFRFGQVEKVCWEEAHHGPSGGTPLLLYPSLVTRDLTRS